VQKNNSYMIVKYALKKYNNLFHFYHQRTLKLDLRIAH